jgi:hypothetical protein
MNIIVDIQNEKDEQLLKEFLNKMKIPFKTLMDGDEISINQAYINTYNEEITNAVNEISKGIYTSQEDVEKILLDRRNPTK